MDVYNTMKGHVHLIIGPMFAAKSSAMCNAIERYNIANKLCIIVKYSKDTRYDHKAKNGGLVTHNGREYSKVPVISAEKLADIFNEISEYEVIGIDETQFFLDCVDIVQLLANMGKVVVCAGLDGDYQGKPFGHICDLVPLAEEITKLKAVCMRCNDDASFTSRLSTETDIEIIGGVDKYISVCRKCMWGTV